MRSLRRNWQPIVLVRVRVALASKFNRSRACARLYSREHRVLMRTFAWRWQQCSARTCPRATVSTEKCAHARVQAKKAASQCVCTRACAYGGRKNIARTHASALWLRIYTQKTQANSRRLYARLRRLEKTRHTESQKLGNSTCGGSYLHDFSEISPYSISFFNEPLKDGGVEEHCKFKCIFPLRSIIFF